jgi:hypothetical protein
MCSWSIRFDGGGYFEVEEAKTGESRFARSARNDKLEKQEQKQRQRQKQISCGNDNQKSKNNIAPQSLYAH